MTAAGHETPPLGLLRHLDEVTAARYRKQARCAVRGHDYTPDGECRRCHLTVKPPQARP